ncbi:MAG: tetratricopeptide repeat protein [Polyangiaceae bacterium]|nr:tetratricopeptide repeat protein [Polyangiaceae bacterium]
MGLQASENDTKTSEPRPKTWRPRAEHLIWLPALVAFVIYLPTLNHEGVIDDRLLILENPYLAKASGLFELWTQDLWEASAMHSSTQYYRPLPMTLYWMQIMLLGPKLWWLRLGNILIFAGTAALLPRLILRTHPKLGIPIATIISLCWALHPLNSEAVIWLSGRFDTLVLFFSVAALMANTHARKNILFPLFLALALLTKEVGIVLFPAVVLADIVQHGGLRSSVKAEGVKWLASLVVVGLYLALRRSLGIYGATDVLFGMSPSVFLSGLADLALTYTRLTFVPLGLDVHHWSVTRSLSTGLIVLGMFVAAFVGSFVYSWKRKKGAIIAACTLGCSSLMLAANVGPSQNVFGDRFWSLLGIGLVLVVSEAIETRAPIRRIWMVPSIAASVVLGMLTVLRGTDWQSEERMADRALEQEPDHPHWLMISSRHLLRRGFVDDARTTLERLIKIQPDMAKAHNALCVVELRSNRLEQAERECRSATRLSPDNASAWVNLASVHVNARRYEETREAAEKALSIQPKNPEAEYLLSLVHANLGAFDVAEQHVQRGLALSPDHKGLRKLEAQLAARRRQP